MNLEGTLDEIKKLDVTDRLWLAQAIWDTIDECEVPTEPSDELKELLDRRIADMRANPEGVLTLDELTARVRGRQ